jgi:hypothetical protein
MNNEQAGRNTTGDGMTRAERTAVGGLFLAAVSALAAGGQAAGGKDPLPRVLEVTPGPASAGSPAAGEALREIDDLHTGDRWLLMRDSIHPGGPGRLVLVADGGSRSGPGEAGSARPEASPAADRRLPAPVIRAGDRLVLEEKTAVIEARLEAVALGPAANGAPLTVRLEIGGMVVQAVALGPGRAAFAEQIEVRP